MFSIRLRILQRIKKCDSDQILTVVLAVFRNYYWLPFIPFLVRNFKHLKNVDVVDTYAFFQVVMLMMSLSSNDLF